MPNYVFTAFTLTALTMTAHYSGGCSCMLVAEDAYGSILCGSVVVISLSLVNNIQGFSSTRLLLMHVTKYKTC